jgi:hypothetical protein
VVRARVDDDKVPKKAVPKRKPTYLKENQVLAVLFHVRPRWRAAFATGVYAGLRKGEIFGLRKADVDLEQRLIHVRRSHGADTTKGGHEDVIPIPAELVPHLRQAMDESPSPLVFPRPDGSAWPEGTDLVSILRTALRRAGFVTGYVHKCQRKGCGYQEPSQDATQRRCPRCNMKLWAIGQVAPFRFHDTRHTTAALLLRFGASPAAVQKHMRHSDIRITLDTYGHVGDDFEFLRREVDRLSFGATTPPPAPTAENEAAGPGGAQNSGPFAAPVLPTHREVAQHRDPGGDQPLWFQPLPAVGATGFEPARGDSEETQVRRGLRRDFRVTLAGGEILVAPARAVWCRVESVDSGSVCKPGANGRRGHVSP